MGETSAAKAKLTIAGEDELEDRDFVRSSGWILTRAILSRIFVRTQGLARRGLGAWRGHADRTGPETASIVPRKSCARSVSMVEMPMSGVGSRSDMEHLSGRQVRAHCGDGRPFARIQYAGPLSAGAEKLDPLTHGRVH